MLKFKKRQTVLIEKIYVKSLSLLDRNSRAPLGAGAKYSNNKNTNERNEKLRQARSRKATKRELNHILLIKSLDICILTKIRGYCYAVKRAATYI
jgi:hypothetical protein